MDLESIPEFTALPNFSKETIEPMETPEPVGTPVEVKGQPAESVAEPEEGSAEPVKDEGEETSEPVKADASEPEPVKEEPAKESEAPTVTPADLNVLQLACDALGITETDPTKQAEAIAEAKAQIETRRQAEAQTAEETRLKQAEDTWTKAAVDATHAEIMAQLKNAGYTVDANGKNIWDAATWADDYDDPAAYVQAMISAYNELRDSPLTRAYFETQFNGAKSAYEATQAKIGETLAKYPHHDPQVAALCRDNGVDPTIIEQVARYTHEHTAKAIATTNSALAAAQAKIADLEAQTSGHDAALKAAVADERKRILSEMGKPNPASTGTGAMSPSETGAYKSTGISAGIWNRIPSA